MILFGDRQPDTWLNLRFGKVEALFALPPVLLLLTIIVLEILGVPLQWHFNGGPAIILFCVMAVVIFFLGRFCLVFPIAVMERRFDFGQAWALSHGNVWRMIGVWIIVTSPPFMVAGACAMVAAHRVEIHSSRDDSQTIRRIVAGAFCADLSDVDRPRRAVCRHLVAHTRRSPALRRMPR